jgi:hypothetical protein
VDTVGPFWGLGCPFPIWFPLADFSLGAVASKLDRNAASAFTISVRHEVLATGLAQGAPSWGEGGDVTQESESEYFFGS